MLAVAFFPHRLNATRSSEATLSQELHTTRLLLLHVSVEYRWQHIGLSPVSRPNGYVCGFVSQPSKPRMHLSMHVAFQHQQDDSVRERDTFLRCGRPYWISMWHVRQRTRVFRWRAAMVCTHRGFSRPVYFSKSLSARM
jgi:hypothetical protein